MVIEFATRERFSYREHLPTIREMFFKIDDRFRTAALNKISDSAGVPVIGNANLVLVGVHVRRTDFVHSARREGGRLATGDFFRKAMEWFRRKYGSSERRVMFVVVSDDMDWYVERLESARLSEWEVRATHTDSLPYTGADRTSELTALTTCTCLAPMTLMASPWKRV